MSSPSPWGARPSQAPETSLENGLPALKGFDRYYHDALKPIMAKLESERPAYQKRFKKFAWGAGGFFLLCLALVMGLRVSGGFLIAAGVISLIILFLGYYPLMDLKERGKLTMMTHLCRFLGLEYRQTPKNISLDMFRSLSLIPLYNESQWEDQIFGKIEGIDLNLFEATLDMVTRDRKGRSRRIQVFNGLLVEFDFYKNFKSTTVITRDFTKLGNLLGGLNKRGKRVRLESVNFERLFEVYSTDQVEARYLLTPAFMERVCSLSATVGHGNLQMAFHKGSLYMAIRKKEDCFEGGEALNNLATPELARKIITELAQIYDIVQILKLDMESQV